MTAKFEDLPESVQAQLREEMLHEEPAPETRAYVEERVAVLRAEAAAQLKAEVGLRGRLDATQPSSVLKGAAPIDWDAEREADEQLDAALQALTGETAEQAQARFDKAQAEAAGVPLDFAQLYSKVQAEILTAIADQPQPPEVVTAAVIQLVTGYCAAPFERKLVELEGIIGALQLSIRDSEETAERRGSIITGLMTDKRNMQQRLNVLHIAVGKLMELNSTPELVITDEYLRRTTPGLVTIFDERMMGRTRITHEGAGE
ncbi:hypothetical protein FDH47_gp43 [Arthrobacter phage Brent]|uniref:Uncharacterized protein n=2 Tax=Marthavirus brent TaxID=1980948 RepID=A0A222Z3H5_9CAUD|nr:hypothetical protein FDH47_gp43 [Arthrobacter phage Brent]ALF01254.1 hypothetical protein SEA_BRENT_43 [Arthrobacter phage Brent]ASR78145.1 hypothetical protein SEA_FRANZY_43 [Arthrobacter phage Franzy]